LTQTCQWSARSPGVDGEHDALVTKALRRLGDQIGVLHGGGIDGDLLGAAAQQLVDLLDALDAAADRKRDEDVLGYFLHHVDDGLARADRGGDVQEDQLVGSHVTVSGPQLDRVAGVAEVEEVDPLDHAIVFDVETGNDSFGQHVAAFRPQIS